MPRALSNRQRSGTSLIEMMVLIAIVGVLAATSGFAMRSWRDAQRIQTTSRSIADLVHLGRGEAIRTGVAHLVFFGSDTAAASLVTPSGDAAAATYNCSRHGSDGASAQPRAIQGRSGRVRSSTHLPITPGELRMMMGPGGSWQTSPSATRRPAVGLKAHTPHHAAGVRTEPPMSEPKPSGEARAATRAASASQPCLLGIPKTASVQHTQSLRQAFPQTQILGLQLRTQIGADGSAPGWGGPRSLLGRIGRHRGLTFSCISLSLLVAPLRCPALRR